MSNFDSTWTEQHRADAAQEGWELGFVVDEGKPVHTAYLDIFDVGPKFPSRRAAVVHVYNLAKQRSRLHIAALTACTSSRVNAAARGQGRKR